LNHCNQCKKHKDVSNFDKKNETEYFTRCKPCREHNTYKQLIKHDIIKNKFCLEHDKVLVRISYLEKNQIKHFIDKGIQQAKDNKPGIIYSNPNLYKTAYLPNMKLM
jgi:hypothetical protein